MPKFGQMTEVSTIVEWKKKEGDRVSRGDILFTVETDKSVMEVEAFVEGVLLKIVVPAGVSVPVNTIVGFIGEPGEPVPDVKPFGVDSQQAKEVPQKKEIAYVMAADAAQAKVVGTGGLVTPQPLLTASGQVETPPAPAVSPRARALARRLAIDVSKVKGSGPGGRVTEKDVLGYARDRGYTNLKITPAALELARREGIDVLEVIGTGSGGRITVEDVRRAIAEKPQPLSRMRQTIAARLTQSFTTQPHFYVTVGVDVTDLIEFRNKIKSQGAPYTVTDFVIQAVVVALQEFPEVNSSTDGHTVRRHQHVNIGLAVAVEGGLVVPVIRYAECKSMYEIAMEAKQLAEKARLGKLTPDEMSGGTFTISNLGMHNVDVFHAIINTGEGAILAVASAKLQPAVKDGQIVPRWLMNLTLSGDHRLIDGVTGARFVNALKSKLEDISLWQRLCVW